MGLFSCSIPPSFVLSYNMTTINTTSNWLCSGAFLSPPASSLQFHWLLAADHHSPVPRCTPHAGTSGGQFVREPSPAGYCHPPTAGLTKIEQGPISMIGLSLFSMSPNRAIHSDRSNFYGRSPVGAPGRVAGGHFRRAQAQKEKKEGKGDSHQQGKGDSHQIWRIQEKEKETATSNRGQPTIVSSVFHGAKSSIPAPIAWSCP